ncbi:MBL fold metallo-hydrolase [Nonomuraea muscovyensis]
MIATPGHTDGSIALHLPGPGVLFTGDTVAHVNGQVTPGVFNLDRAEMLRSFGRLAELDARIACASATAGPSWTRGRRCARSRPPSPRESPPGVSPPGESPGSPAPPGRRAGLRCSRASGW